MSNSANIKSTISCLLREMARFCALIMLNAEAAWLCASEHPQKLLPQRRPRRAVRFTMPHTSCSDHAETRERVVRRNTGRMRSSTWSQFPAAGECQSCPAAIMECKQRMVTCSH